MRLVWHSILSSLCRYRSSRVFPLSNFGSCCLCSRLSLNLGQALTLNLRVLLWWMRNLCMLLMLPTWHILFFGLFFSLVQNICLWSWGLVIRCNTCLARPIKTSFSRTEISYALHATIRSLPCQTYLTTLWRCSCILIKRSSFGLRRRASITLQRLHLFLNMLLKLFVVHI